jgi:hemerythrin-like domain-containing protein
MLVVHQAFRNAYDRMPELVRAVSPGKTRRAAVVSDHIQLIDGFLHLHHKGEDELLWPKLVERAPADLRPTLTLLEDHHEEIDKLLTESSSLRAEWRANVDAATGEKLADSLRRLGRRLDEHLTIEEEKVLTVVHKYVSAEEWHKIGEHAINGLKKKELPIIFGMLASIAQPEVVTLMLTTAPFVPRLIMPVVGPRAFAAHAKRVYGADR